MVRDMKNNIQLSIGGMSCAGCVSTVESALHIGEFTSRKRERNIDYT